jgi:hypothetical protein
MNFESVRSATLLGYALAVLLTGCATNSAETSPVEPNMQSLNLSDSAEVVEARKVFKDEMERTPLVKNVVFHIQPGEVRYIEYTDPSKNRVDVIQLTSLLPDSIVVSYKPGAAFRYPAWKVSYTDYVQKHKYYWLSSSWSKSDAESAAKALKVLVLDARRDLDQILAANLEKFRLSCQSWQALQEKPPIPEEALQHKVLAENASREKRLDIATDEYLNALKAYPCWPEGQFNAASILGDTGWYTAAVAHMQYYLELVPDAPDAQVARDRITAWQGKLGRTPD